MSGLAAHGVDVRLGAKQVLRDVSFSLDPGQVTAIVGPNGAGKSTLFDALAGLRRPDAGEVRLDEAPVLSLRPRARAQKIAVLPQNPEVAWAVTTETFVGLGRTAHTGAWGLGAEDRAVVARAMAGVGVVGLADRIVTSLSGGERAAVLVARALAGEPQWLLADEPLTGLDLGHTLDVVTLFRGLAAAGCGVVVTLHDLAVAARAADRVIVLAQGRVIADGAPADCLTPATLADAYGVQARITPGEAGPLVEVLGRAG